MFVSERNFLYYNALFYFQELDDALVENAVNVKNKNRGDSKKVSTTKAVLPYWFENGKSSKYIDFNCNFYVLNYFENS